MTKEQLLTILKLKLGISSTVKDLQLNLLIDATEKMLDDEKGIEVDMDNPMITEFMLDYSAWKYESKGESGGMPRHLQYRLHNLMIHNQKPEEVF